ncbi:MAG: DNA polymerase III subunit delta [Dehalococcoidia bacterium]
MLHILFGADDFSMREELENIKEGLGDKELLVSNTTVFEGHQLKLGQLVDVCGALPFFGSHRLVIVKGLLGRFGEGEGRSLKDLVGGMPETTVLVFIDGQIKRDNPLLKELAPQAKVKEFPLLRGAALRGWIQRRVAKGSGTISPQAMRLLAALVGENLWVLASEIEKLLLYTYGRRIEEGDVREVVSYAREASVFAMVDALIEGRASTAARLLHQLLQEGATAPYLLFMITRQLRLLVQAKELTLKGVPASLIKDRLGLASDYTLTKALEQSKRYSMGRLEQVYRKLLETDLAIKRGKWKGELALDLLVAELCA